MTITENRAADRRHGSVDARLQAHAVLLDDPSMGGSRVRPAVVIAAPDEPQSEGPFENDCDFPLLDGWIVDLSLRDERITVVTRTDVLCSAPLSVLPDGWTAAVAAQGLLDVVVQFGPDGPIVGSVGLPSRAMREATVLAARIPVCLS